MKEQFTCIDCKEVYPKGLDVEHDMYLDTHTNEELGGARCVHCYNAKLINSANALNVEQCYHHAYNLEHYGIAILDSEVGKTWEEIQGGI